MKPLSDLLSSSNGEKAISQLEAATPSNIALGVERIGFAGLRFSLLSVVAVAVLAVAAVFGVLRIKVDDSLNQLFRSETPQFKQYEEVTRRFPSSEYDVLVVVQGKALLSRNAIAHLRDLVTDLQLVDGARGIISLFSARQPPQNGGLPGPLFPDELPSGAEYDQLVAKVGSNEIIRGKLLSDDGTLALIVLSLEPDIVSGGDLNKTVADIRKTMADDLAGSDLGAELSGVPVMQLEIRNAVERDRILYNVIGFVAGCAIAVLFFRRISFMIVAAAPPLLAILLALGGLGWLDFRLNMFLNVMTPLIMVISFSDSMQLTFAARERLIAGEDRRAAFRNAVWIVGPACVLTHATAALSFAALQFSDSDLIKAFGEAGLIATIIALLTVLTLVPALGVLLVRREGAFAVKMRGADTGVDVLRRFCGWVARRMVSRPGLYSLISLIVVAGLGVNYINLQPRYRLADQVPDKQQAVQANNQLDAKLKGANPIDVLITLPKDSSLYAPQSLLVIDEVHSLFENQRGVANVWSLETLRRWLAEKLGKTDAGTLKEYVDALPTYLVRRFIDAKQEAVVIEGRVPDKDASELLPIVNELDQKLDTVRKSHPDYQIAVTGLSAIAARSSADMIGKLSRGLTIEFLFVAAFVGLAFRSVPVAFAAILPGIFPILSAGVLLSAMGEGLQFASVVALIVSFGLGLSATIHFLNRMRRERRPGDDPAIAVERATVLIGPALIVTSIVLACGLAVTSFSDLPTLRLFGRLSAFAMLMALTADLLILRPVITLLSRLADTRGRAGRRALPMTPWTARDDDPDGSVRTEG
jgi:predicted RND superfamily exporter protein